MVQAYGIKPKNSEQAEALKALLDPSIELVVMEGIAGSGKTLLALASALEQIVEQHMYKELVFTRAPVAVGDDIGFLPGTEEDKMLPWAGGLLDNLEVLLGNSKMTEDFVQKYIKIRAMCYMRGRSFNQRFVIIDEVQNISCQQLKVLLTRAGEGSKVVCLGDIHQIDSRKLNVESNALSYLIQASSHQDFISSIYLPACERSRLSAWAAKEL